MMAMFTDSLTSYFHKDSDQWYARPLNEAPATTFLHSVVDICESVSYCEDAFAKINGAEAQSRSDESLRAFAMSAFAMLMSHFEMFQKLQFAELVDTQDFMDGFDDTELAKRLEKEGCTITLQRILAGRGDPREPGQIVADSLSAWHNPSRVNQYFQAIFPKIAIYSNSAVAELELMWQLRHSIVHTGGVVTREDAAKVVSLRRFRDRKLILEGEFITQVGKRLHMIVKQATGLLEAEVRSRFIHSEFIDDPEGIIESVVGCESPNQSWFEA
jgi:hypothetical protein